ncbi:hypothetical protein ACQJBY_013151 [Aegilops geniculata]
MFQSVQARTPTHRHLIWRKRAGHALSSASRSGKLVLHHCPPTVSRKQAQRNWAEWHEKKMWLASSTVPQMGHIPSPGPFRLRTSTPEGSRPRIHCHCHRKIRIFSGTRISQIRLNGSGADEGAMAPYKDFVEKHPEGSRCQDRVSRSFATSIGRRAMSWRRTSQAATSGGPNGRRKARHPKSIRAVSTDTRGSTAMANNSGKCTAKGAFPSQRSNQNRVEAPEPAGIEVPMRSTGRSWITDCQNWEPPVRVST